MRLDPLFSSDRMDWETPPDLFARYDAVNHFTLDPCATAANAKCGRFYTVADDGLSLPWAPERVWMNPPYGREIGKWMAKALGESRRGALVVCLVPSRTDTAWWHDYAMKGEIEFLRGRLRFVGAPSSAPFPSAVIIFRPALASAAPGA